MVDKIQKAIDSKNYSCGIFIDLCKAFDTGDRHILQYLTNWNTMASGALHMNGFPPIYLIGVNLLH